MSKHNIQINAATPNVQIGDRNTQNVTQLTYNVLLQELQREVEKSNLPAEEKEGLMQNVKALLAHPLTQSVVQASAQVAAVIMGNG